MRDVDLRAAPACKENFKGKEFGGWKKVANPGLSLQFPKLKKEKFSFYRDIVFYRKYICSISGKVSFYRDTVFYKNI